MFLLNFFMWHTVYKWQWMKFRSIVCTTSYGACQISDLYFLHLKPFFGLKNNHCELTTNMHKLKWSFVSPIIFKYWHLRILMYNSKNPQFGKKVLRVKNHSDQTNFEPWICIYWLCRIKLDERYTVNRIFSSLYIFLNSVCGYSLIEIYLMIL